jgi:phage I-like protein
MLHDTHPCTDTALLALCRELAPSAAGDPPEWLLLVPAGEILGRDGRRFSNPDPATVVDAFDPAAQLPLDWEHATHLRAPQGQDAPAAAWVTALEARDGEVWGRVEWNAAGAEAVRSRAYRYYSPAYLLGVDGAVVRLLSVGLTNTPNLTLPALNRHGPSSQATEPGMDESIRTALDLPEGATPEQAAAKIVELKTALNRAATPDLTRFVPRADLDAALNRAAQAETSLRETQQAELDRRVDALIQAGLNAARITPATEQYHRAAAKAEGGIERLQAYLDAAPAVVSGETRTAKPADGVPALNSDAARIAAAFGQTAETLNKFGGE